MKSKLIIGLGNIGNEYVNTRHNIGFMALDCFARNNQLDFTYEKKFDGAVASMVIGDTKVFFLQPHTLMNHSGFAVRKIMLFYKIHIDDILVIVDDLNLSLGHLRLREKGSSGGHNGLNNINAQLGSDHYKRVRVGIGQTKRSWIDFVLSKFNQDELFVLNDTFQITNNIILDFIKGDKFQAIMSKYNHK